LLLCDRAMLHEIDRRLQYGPGMRVQRLVEAGLLIAAFFSGDVRFVYVTLGLALLQTVSARLVPIALVVAAFRAAPREHRLSDLYFDLGGTRGACAVSACALVAGIWLVRAGHGIAGWLVLALPTASYVLTPTVGFCCGCAVYVAMREVLAKLGVAKRYANGACDIAIDRTEASDHQ
jgi:hypothetical protein